MLLSGTRCARDVRMLFQGGGPFQSNSPGCLLDMLAHHILEGLDHALQVGAGGGAGEEAVIEGRERSPVLCCASQPCAVLH